MGAALGKLSGTFWKPLGFFSKKFLPAQLTYATYDRELIAVYNAIQHLDYYLENHLFKVYTDHKPSIYALQHAIAFNVMIRSLNGHKSPLLNPAPYNPPDPKA